MSSIPSTPLHLVSSQQFQQCLNENQNIISAIITSWNSGNVVECLEYEALLHNKLEYLTAVANAQCQFPSGPVAPQQMMQTVATTVPQQASSWPQSQQNPMLPLQQQWQLPPIAIRPQVQQNQLFELIQQQQYLYLHRTTRHEEMLKFKMEQQVVDGACPWEQKNPMLKFQQYRQKLHASWVLIHQNRMLQLREQQQRQYEQNQMLQLQQQVDLLDEHNQTFQQQQLLDEHNQTLQFQQQQQLASVHSHPGSSGSSNQGSQAAAFDSISGSGHGKSGGIKD